MNRMENHAVEKGAQWGTALAVATLSAALVPSLAARKEPGSCTTGMSLRLSAPESAQGSLLLIQLRSSSPLAKAQGDWGGRGVPLWSETDGEYGRRGLLAVDLEKAPGEYELRITGQTTAGETVSCSVMVPVRKGVFATEKLQVQKQFVEPSPEQIKRADEERQKLREIFDRVTPVKLWDGEFRIPLDGVTTASNFGKRRILNGNPGSPHAGADLSGATGTPVHAAQSGRVALAEELFFSGNTVVVDHGLGIYTFYGHLSQIDVKAGDDVEAGTVLGKVGATGRVTGPHLHWGLTVERARVNPMLLLKLLSEEQKTETIKDAPKP